MGRWVGGLLGFVGMSAIAGVLVTVAVTPALAVSGMAATNTMNVFENLPEYLKIDQLSQKSNIYAKKDDGGKVLLASFYDQNRVEVGWDQINQFVKDAAVAGEDPHFYEHGGIDIGGTIKGAVQTVATGRTRGGSSITQQYVKNVLVQKCELISNEEKRNACYTDATETSAERKLQEMRYAIGVEKEYSKDEILNGYLNIALFGGTVYGIESAANYYYNTSASKLTLPQAASLVAIVNNPVKFQLDNPDSPTNGKANGYADNKSRRDYILDEMLKYGKITEKQHDEAIATKIEPKITPPSTGCASAKANAYFCDYVTHILRTDPTFGKDEETRQQNFRRGGFDVYTTLDLDVQNAAVKTIKKNVPMTYDGWNEAALATSVQVGTGRILAMAQNKIYSQDPDVLAKSDKYSPINYNTDVGFGGSSGFQPGSTYKVFTLAEWLKEGHTLKEHTDSAYRDNWGDFRDSCHGTQNYDAQGFSPQNDEDGETGSDYTALYATERSINTAFIGMAKELDLCGIANTAKDFGVHRADGDPLKQSAGTVLGTNEIAPLTMVTAYAGIANKGKVCTPIAIDKIIGPEGKELPIPKSECHQAIDKKLNAGLTYAMGKVMTDDAGTATSSYYATEPKVPMIGKTGTTDGNVDTWMNGASTKVATVVGLVGLKGEGHHVLNQREVFFDSGRAAEARHRMWPDIMSVANAKYGGDDFPEPAPDVIQAPQVSIPDVRGMSVSEAQSALNKAGFNPMVGGDVDSSLPKGTVTGTDPSGITGRGSTVTIYTSNGSLTVVPDVTGQNEQAARGVLSGFGVSTETKDTSDKSQDGVVISQSPGGGNEARPGSNVTITIGHYVAPPKEEPKPTATKAPEPTKEPTKPKDKKG
ncbi:transglycosylase domain-containing protein [Cryobacterium tepidiphilum]|nr:transglycosylase domain-containing protein [Cryobacterium tepidiphilum]